MYKIKKILSYVILLLTLSSCDGPDTWCWESGNDSYSDTNVIETTVANNIEIWAFSAPYENYPDGYGLWVDTGFDVNEGASYQISVPSGTGSEIIIASDYNSTLNGGLGQPYIIQASNGSPTPIVDDTGAAVQFAQNQQITVTVADCTTGTASYGTTNPTKWTWSNNWRYETVMCKACNGNNTGNATDVDCTSVSQCVNYAPPTGSSSPTSTCKTSSTNPDCIAYIGCQSCTSQCPVTSCNSCSLSCGCGLTTKDTGTTCGGMGGFSCSHVQLSFASDKLPYTYGFTSTNTNGSQTTYDSSYYDVCPTNSYPASSAPPANSFVCQFQDGDTTSESAYASTYPTFKGSGTGSWNSSVPPSDNNAKFCDGYTNFYPCGFASNWSDSYPGSSVTNYDKESWPSNYSHCNDSPTTEQSSESIHLTGNVDTCWNTGGYQLYGIQQGVQCPTSVDDQCIQMWYEYKDDEGNTTANGYVSDGNGNMVLSYTTTFASIGGPFWLEIINPNSYMPEEDTDLQNEIDTNNQTIDQCNTDNTNLYPTLTNNLVAVNSYSDEVENLIEQGYSYSATGNITDATAQQYMVDILNFLDGYTPESGAYVQGVNDAFTTLNTILNGADFNPADTSWEPSTLPTSYTYSTYSSCSCSTSCSNPSASWTPTTYPAATDASDIYDLSGNAIIAAQNLTTYLNSTPPPSLTGSTTSAELLSYCSSLISDLQEIQEAIVDVECIQSQIDYNNYEITKLTDQNTDDYNTILGLNTFDNSGAVGGYTAYVAAGPLAADYGQYLKAIIVQNGEDPNSALTNADDNPGQFTTIFDYTSSSSSTDYPLKEPVSYVPPETGRVWMKIYDPDGNYYNNSQSYIVDFASVEYTSGFSTMMTDVIALIQESVKNATQTIYLGITCYQTGQDRTTGLCTDYINSIDILLHMYVIIFGIMYLFGLIKTDYVDFVMRIVKIAIISTLLQPYSLDFFTQYLFDGFSGLSNTLITAATGAPSSNPFDFISQSVNVLLIDQTTYFKIIGLLFQGLLGIVAFLLMVYGCISFVVAIFNAFIMYMTSFIGMGLCVALSPIFIIFFLFEKTNHLFENWFKAMVKLTIIPAVLLIGLIIINGMLASILQSLLNYAVCFKCTMPFTFAIPGFPSVGDTTLFCVSWFSKWGADNVGSAFDVALMSFPLALNFCILTEVMRLYSDKLAIQVANGIVGSSSLFSARNPHASMGMPLKGLRNDLKYMDKKVEKFAIRSGIAKDKEEYKGMRNRALKKGASFAAKTSVLGPVGAIGAIASSISKFTSKKPNDANNTSTTKKQNLAEQKTVLQQKLASTSSKANVEGITKTQQKKLNKQADKLQAKIDSVNRKQQYADKNIDKPSQKQNEMHAKLIGKLNRTQQNIDNFKAAHHGKLDNPEVKAKLDKLTKLKSDTATKLQELNKNSNKGEANNKSPNSSAPFKPAPPSKEALAAKVEYDKQRQVAKPAAPSKQALAAKAEYDKQRAQTDKSTAPAAPAKPAAPSKQALAAKAEYDKQRAQTDKPAEASSPTSLASAPKTQPAPEAPAKHATPVSPATTSNSANIPAKASSLKPDSLSSSEQSSKVGKSTASIAPAKVKTDGTASRQPVKDFVSNTATLEGVKNNNNNPIQNEESAISAITSFIKNLFFGN